MLEIRSKMKYQVFALVILLLTFGCSNSDLKESNTGVIVDNYIELGLQIDSLINYYHEDQGLSIAMLVANNNSIIYQNATGYMHPETKEPLNINSSFNLASVSKQFTAMAVVMLGQRGLLGLDDDVRKHLPDLPDFGPTITLRPYQRFTRSLGPLGNERRDDG
jgi:hypothetical protein